MHAALEAWDDHDDDGDDDLTDDAPSYVLPSAGVDGGGCSQADDGATTIGMVVVASVRPHAVQ